MASYEKRSAAIHRVREAMVRGEMSRPETCEKCGIAPGLAKDGRSKIHGHHPDYDKPLEVIWLCIVCHSMLHREEKASKEQALAY